MPKAQSIWIEELLLWVRHVELKETKSSGACENGAACRRLNICNEEGYWGPIRDLTAKSATLAVAFEGQGIAPAIATRQYWQPDICQFVAQPESEHAHHV
jgi:hypothetical protein